MDVFFDDKLDTVIACREFITTDSVVACVVTDTVIACHEHWFRCRVRYRFCVSVPDICIIVGLLAIFFVNNWNSISAPVEYLFCLRDWLSALVSCFSTAGLAGHCRLLPRPQSLALRLGKKNVSAKSGGERKERKRSICIYLKRYMNRDDWCRP